MLPDDLSPHVADVVRRYDDTPSSVLVLGAHPDDAELGAGGTVARWSSGGSEVHLCVLTDGSKGSWDPTDDPADVAGRRRQEQADAAIALRLTGEIHWGPWADGELVADPASVRWVCGLIRMVRPELVVGHDPWRRYRLHPDHRHGGLLAVDGVVAARDAHFHPDQDAPHRPEALLLFEADEPDTVVPLDDDSAQRKIDALLCHRSQWRSTMGIDHGDDPAVSRWNDRVRDRLAAHAALLDSPEVRLGESFRWLAT
ncbi:MAG TPA: PIG-L family deacetylase [Acidimicrobiales bacterium]